MFLKVANFFLPYLCSVFILLGRKTCCPDILHQLCKVLISTQLCKVLLPISSRVVHKYILHDFGDCCESVPLDRLGSYVSISIKIYITIILAHVVQVDAFYCESLSCYICIVMVVVCCTSCVELEYWFSVRVWYNQGFTVEQCLLWVTCTGRHWLIALWTMIGATC